MRWDIIFCIVMITLSVIIVIKRWIEGEKQKGRRPETRQPVPFVAPPPAPVIKLANRSHGWMWVAIILVSLLVLVSFGMINRIGEKEYLLKSSTTKATQTPAKSKPNKATVVVWRGHPAKISFQRPLGPHFQTSVVPSDHQVSVTTPDGKIRIAGRGHEKDDWGNINKGNKLDRTWKVSTTETEKTFFTVSW